MIVIHLVNGYYAGMDDTALPRLAIGSLEHRLRVMPVAVVTGARQTGKAPWYASSPATDGDTSRSTISTLARRRATTPRS